MNEQRARNLTIILIALQAIFIFNQFRTTISYAIKELSIQGAKPEPDLIVLLDAFLSIGIIIILSAYFKPMFYLMTVLATGFYIHWLCMPRLHIIPVIIFLILMSPIIYYYAARIIQRVRNHRE